MTKTGIGSRPNFICTAKTMRIMNCLHDFLKYFFFILSHFLSMKMKVHKQYLEKVARRITRQIIYTIYM